MSSTVYRDRIEVAHVLLVLGILAFVQLLLMSDEDPCRWIRWARLATAGGILALGLVAVGLGVHRSRQAEPPRAPGAPKSGHATPTLHPLTHPAQIRARRIPNGLRH